MNTTTRFTALALTLAATAFAQASEVTDFAVPTRSTLTRAEVKAEARRANDAGLLRYDELGARSAPAAAASVRTRSEVRSEAMASARIQGRAMAGNYFVGGM